jgi:hypothetical protein
LSPADLGARRLFSAFQIGDDLLALVLNIVDLRQLANFSIDEVHGEDLPAHAVARRRIRLAGAIRWRCVDRNAELLELLRPRDHAFRADLPLKLHRHHVRLLGKYAFEARIVVCQALDLGVDLLVTLKDGADPEGGAGDLVRKAEQIEDLGAALADRDGARRRLVEGDLPSAILECQRIGRLGSEGGMAESRCACGKGDETRNERSFQKVVHE